MRIVYFLLALVFCGVANAGGKLQIEPFWRNNPERESGFRMGISAYEKLWGRFYLNSYSGMGLLRDAHNPQHEIEWGLLKNGLVYQVNPMLQLEGGLRIGKGEYRSLGENWQTETYVKLGAQLW